MVFGAAAVVVSCAAAVAAAVPVSGLAGAQAPAVREVPRTAFVHLFEWPHLAVAAECEEVLGPAGYSAVQVSPVNEHRVITTPDYRPWYERYQPVSYKLDSRGGSRAEFIEMVERCAAVDVDIYVDLVFNHMTGGGSGVGSAGSAWNADTLNFPDFGPNDFHGCDGCTEFCEIGDYNDRFQVQYCRLVGLRDLVTDSDYVRKVQLDFLNDMIGIGVAGFRLDASKHVPTEDINWIVNAVDSLADGRRPYIFQEVIDLGGEAIGADEYVPNGDVTEFRFGNEVGRAFKRRGQSLAFLDTIGPDWGWLTTFDAVTFVANHDTQRGHGPGGDDIVTYKDGDLHVMAETFALAHPYGYPKVLSSYSFDDTEAGPPMEDDGTTLWPGDCDFGWVCEHRIPAIQRMVMFRNVVASNHTITRWWSDGADKVGFSVGNLGFYAANADFEQTTMTYETGLPRGTYCDIISGEVNGDGTACTGKTIEVDDNGQATFEVSGGGPAAVAFYVGMMVVQ